MSKKIKYQILRKDFEESDFFKNWPQLLVCESPFDVSKEIPLIIGGDVCRDYVRNFLNLKYPAIYVARGYIGNHLYKRRKFWRYSINGIANTRILNLPYSRWPLMNLVKHPWKVSSVKKVLIAPSKMTSEIWDPINGKSWANYISTKFQGAEIKIRNKDKLPHLRWSTLWNDLDWADLVVAQSSAITAEAFWYGKKVISLNPCCTWAAGQQLLEDWKNPTEPKLRDVWHEHVAWSQFTNEEWISGEAIDLISQFVGDVKNYDPQHTYNFK